MTWMCAASGYNASNTSAYVRFFVPPCPRMSDVSAARPSLPAGSSTEPTWKYRRIATKGLVGDGTDTVLGRSADFGPFEPFGTFGPFGPFGPFEACESFKAVEAVESFG